MDENTDTHWDITFSECPTPPTTDTDPDTPPVSRPALRHSQSITSLVSDESRTSSDESRKKKLALPVKSGLRQIMAQGKQKLGPTWLSERTQRDVEEAALAAMEMEILVMEIEANPDRWQQHEDEDVRMDEAKAVREMERQITVKEIDRSREELGSMRDVDTDDLEEMQAWGLETEMGVVWQNEGEMIPNMAMSLTSD
eukprot:comp20040_c0_seq1/m.24608 comp20040_c0_seq1/g.24608  ORF comp20040_c0_seq1/g.24608 comp20040_c0_seq1/m.24608 type:complete len:198 (-) comp20040_c0_seq1:765-1358(-)